MQLHQQERKQKFKGKSASHLHLQSWHIFVAAFWGNYTRPLRSSAVCTLYFLLCEQRTSLQRVIHMWGVCFFSPALLTAVSPNNTFCCQALRSLMQSYWYGLNGCKHHMRSSLGLISIPISRRWDDEIWANNDKDWFANVTLFFVVVV